MARLVGDVLSDLEVPWLVGGSAASSVHGVPRSTQDIDLLAALRPEHLAPLVAALDNQFAVSEEAILQAIRRRSCFNAIHFDLAYKIDVFVAQDDALTREELARRVWLVIDDADGATMPFATAEDTILRKLLWFERGGRSSERQLTDIRGVWDMQRDGLDLEYLSRHASALGIADLLASFR